MNQIKMPISTFNLTLGFNEKTKYNDKSLTTLCIGKQVKYSFTSSWVITGRGI